MQGNKPIVINKNNQQSKITNITCNSNQKKKKKNITCNIVFSLLVLFRDQQLLWVVQQNIQKICELFWDTEPHFGDEQMRTVHDNTWSKFQVNYVNFITNLPQVFFYIKLI